MGKNVCRLYINNWTFVWEAEHAQILICGDSRKLLWGNEGILKIFVLVLVFNGEAI